MGTVRELAVVCTFNGTPADQPATATRRTRHVLVLYADARPSDEGIPLAGAASNDHMHLHLPVAWGPNRRPAMAPVIAQRRQKGGL